ncbi:venom serine protease-like [Cotesia glomerata]|uniref:Peptidase S1 domain-containing protein n=1 Tax=Cotesia glomerata TaxID=32391 RepID=A0AAV7J4Z6_COTGL|nr:venom serine protease-like [Cotesia glomerata]KAH0566768.1 hypothetical protein KQX54_003965 [Cotesia glomerata]
MELHRVTNIIVHPNFDQDTIDFDIAVVIVNIPFKYNQLVGPACLPFLNPTNTFEKRQVHLLGWGLLNIGGTQATILQQIKARVVAIEKCKELGKSNSDWSKQLCVLGNNKTTCQSDNGGPVLWRDPVTKRTFLVGIISPNPSCDPEVPSINLRVGAYLDWIERQALKDYSYCKLELDLKLQIQSSDLSIQI